MKIFILLIIFTLSINLTFAQDGSKMESLIKEQKINTNKYNELITTNNKIEFSLNYNNINFFNYLKLKFTSTNCLLKFDNKSYLNIPKFDTKFNEIIFNNKLIHVTNFIEKNEINKYLVYLGIKNNSNHLYFKNRPQSTFIFPNFYNISPNSILLIRSNIDLNINNANILLKSKLFDYKISSINSVVSILSDKANNNYIYILNLSEGYLPGYYLQNIITFSKGPIDININELNLSYQIYELGDILNFDINEFSYMIPLKFNINTEIINNVKFTIEPYIKTQNCSFKLNEAILKNYFTHFSDKSNSIKIVQNDNETSFIDFINFNNLILITFTILFLIFFKKYAKYSIILTNIKLIGFVSLLAFFYYYYIQASYFLIYNLMLLIVIVSDYILRIFFLKFKKPCNRFERFRIIFALILLISTYFHFKGNETISELMITPVIYLLLLIIIIYSFINLTDFSTDKKIGCIK